jgi:hypothetical protein
VSAATVSCGSVAGGSYAADGEPHNANPAPSCCLVFLIFTDNRKMIVEKPISLKENIHIILNGTASEKKNFTRSYFFVADTPQFMKDLGLTGDYFRWIMAGIIVKIVGKNLEVNDIRTAFGYRKRQYGNVNNEFIYVAKKITPEQTAILDGTNFRQYLSVQEFN